MARHANIFSYYSVLKIDFYYVFGKIVSLCKETSVSDPHSFYADPDAKM